MPVRRLLILSLVLVSTILSPGAPAVPAAAAPGPVSSQKAGAQPAPDPLEVLSKSASSVVLGWKGWKLNGRQARLVVYRDGIAIATIGPSRTSYTDAAVAWGTTYAYFVRAEFYGGKPMDTNKVWVTTNADTTRLNIVLIMTDDQRWDTLQYMPLTQQLLGATGVTFTNAFAATPQCCPSRAGVLTGLYSHNHRVLSNEIGAPAFKDASTIGTWLRAAGYRTALIGKYLNGYPGLKPWPYIPPGWSEWDVFKTEGYYDYVLVENGSEVAYGAEAADYSTYVLAAKAADFIRTTPTGQPFLLVFTPFAPHRPASPAREDRGKFADIAPWSPPSYDEADVNDKPAWVRNLGPLTPQERIGVQALRRDQLRSLLGVDRAVKTIIDALAATGKLDSTVIVFTSDNGYAWGEHRWDGKMCAYEECARIPFIVRKPGVASRMDDGLVTLVDLAPSFAAWAGVLHPKIDGLSFARRLAFRQTPWRTDLLIEMLAGEYPMLYSAVHSQRYMYAEYFNGDRELYDLALDPYQLTNVVAHPGYASVVNELRARLAILKAQ